MTGHEYVRRRRVARDCPNAATWFEVAAAFDAGLARGDERNELLTKMVLALCERICVQSDLLGKLAEKPQ